MIENIFSRLNAIPSDKVAHFASGVVLYALCSFFDPFMALAIVFAIAVAKEIYDYMHPAMHTTDVMDALATTLGGVVGLIIALLTLYKPTFWF